MKNFHLKRATMNLVLRLLLTVGVIPFIWLGGLSSFSEQPVPITYARIKSDIQSREIGNLDDLLRFFASSPQYSALLENPVLNETSFALHAEDVTPDFPRIVLHDDHIVMMMVGNPAKDSGQFLEIIEFLPETRKFKFRLINFLAKASGEMFVDDPEFADYVHQFKDASYHEGVFECADCHGYPPSITPGHPELNYGDPRPRWNTQPFWQTPYGKTGDLIAAGSAQEANWKLFQETLKDPVKGSRYRLLKIRTQTDTAGNIVFLDRPNAVLAEQLFSSDFQRIAAIIADSPRYPEVQYAVMGSLLGCDTSGFFPSAWNRQQDQLIRLVTQFNSRLYQLQSISKSLLVPSAFAAYAQKHIVQPGNGSDEVLLTDGDFLALTRLPVRDALRALVEATDKDNLLSVLNHNGQPKFATDLGGFSFEGFNFSPLTIAQAVQEFPSPDAVYEPAVASLRYLLEDSVRQIPLYWSVGVSFPFAFSYRFASDKDGLGRLTRELAPRFLGDNPDLADVAESLLHPGSPDSPPASLCARLQAKGLIHRVIPGQSPPAN